MEYMNKLSLFFESVKTISLWKRIFSWSAVRSLSYDATEEYAIILKELQNYKERLANLEKTTATDAERISALEDKLQSATVAYTKLNSDSTAIKEKFSAATSELQKCKEELAKMKNSELTKTETYHKNVDRLNNAYAELKEEKQRVNDTRVEEKELEFENKKTTWQQHETNIEQEMKRLCAKHTITYLDSVPFRGKPDNPIEICGEIIVFDAKSPSSDDLGNFPTYIKNQAEQANKYAKQSNVKKEIYLVVPSNTVDVIDTFHYNMGGYDVYVITKDALEPVLLSLRKIEEYEFADKLSPEDRTALCRIIGKFAHTTKRRVQIDQYMANHMLELLRLAESELPEDFVQSMKEFEKAEKLNPSTERRKKEIDIEKLSNEHNKLNAQALIRELVVPKSLDDID